jgi:hypothetical protein
VAPLVITSAVRAVAPFTKLNDPGERLSAYLQGIAYWLFFSQIQEIIICDSSQFDYAKLIPRELVDSTGKRVEILSFNGSTDVIARRGKGYGEGETMRFVLENSELVARSRAFFKVTGKLWVSNLEAFSLGSGQQAYFYRPRFRVREEPRLVDTRFYFTDKQLFLDYLADAYRRVDDSAGFFLEHAYYASLPEDRTGRFTSPFLPRLHGIAGTSTSSVEDGALRFRARQLAWRLRTTLLPGLR